MLVDLLEKDAVPFHTLHTRYGPLLELVNKLREQGLQPGYLEVFKAATTALTTVRQAVPEMSLAYHGEGLWITQPDVQESPFFQQDVGEMVTQLNSIQSLWLNHECAMKQMAGYSFGTYVPPLYTPLSAEVMSAVTAATARLWPGLSIIPIMETGATDAVYLIHGGIPTYGVQGLFYDRDDIRFHGRDERLKVESFYQGQTFLYELVKRLSGLPSA